MPYATQQDMDRYFGAAEVAIAADRDGDTENDVGVVTAALNAATEEIDSYLGVRYDLPLANKPPGILLHTCCDMAMYRMSVNHHSMTDEKRERYTDALKWLDKIANGKATLGVEETTEGVQDEAECSSTSEVRLFSRTKMQGLL